MSQSIRKMRIIKIVGNFDDYEMKFDPTVMIDSEALHFLLCQNDPGDEYTVIFENVKEN